MQEEKTTTKKKENLAHVPSAKCKYLHVHTHVYVDTTPPLGHTYARIMHCLIYIK